MDENPYEAFTTSLVRDLSTYGFVVFRGPAPEVCTVDPVVDTKQRPVLIFSPHPDDECIIGALPLRLLRESGRAVINVAVTLGSRKDRQQERWDELRSACACTGFGVVCPVHDGVERISLVTREQDPTHWAECVVQLAAVLRRYNPSIVFRPHARDWNSTHIGTHWLVEDALHSLSNSFSCTVVETEFWGAMESPDLMVESSSEEVAQLMAAIACHVGEVARNPYHLRLPAWMMDNVRRGGELVGGQGGVVPKFAFATLYALKQFSQGVVRDCGLAHPRFLASGDGLEWLFELSK